MGRSDAPLGGESLRRPDRGHADGSREEHPNAVVRSTK
jgi:hypothetical protein